MTESRPYMDKVPELRKKFLDKHYASDKNYYDPRDISRVKSDDLFVQQFLVGKDGTVDKAHKLMIEALQWRKEFGINDISEKDIPEEILKSGYLYIHGKDKAGAHIVFIFTKMFVKGNKDKLLSYKNLFAFTYEKIQREYPGERLTMVNNMKDAGLSNIDTSVNKFLSFLQTTAYPDLLEKAYALHMGKVFEGIWSVFKGLLGSRLSSKYLFPKEEELTNYIDKDQLPLEYGGPFEYKYPPEDKTDKNSNEPASADVPS